MYVKDEIWVSPSLLNFSYKLFAGKHVLDIVIPNIPSIDESDIEFGESVIIVPPMSILVGSHLLKVLMQESKVLQEIIATSISRNCVVEWLI